MLSYFTPFSSVSVVDFEQVNVMWVKEPILFRTNLCERVLGLGVYKKYYLIWFINHFFENNVNPFMHNTEK